MQRILSLANSDDILTYHFSEMDFNIINPSTLGSSRLSLPFTVAVFWVVTA